MSSRIACLCLATLFCGLLFSRTLAGEAQTPLNFQRDVVPILADKCFHCHGPDEEQRQADLRLDQSEPVFADRGGYRVVVPSNLEKSELIRRIRTDDPAEKMPPPDAVRQLTVKETKTLTRWVAEGAEWKKHWAFEPPQRPTPPPATHPALVQNAIDCFVQSRLSSTSFTPSQEANRESLIRRLTLDLTGLPPTPLEVEAFLNDPSPNAFEKVVDRLLASPQYGEHMALPWLDAARYADTDGYQNDRIRYMWVWRDWVIQALNGNKPFDEFTVEQLAGDLLPDATFTDQVATGFGRNHRINSEGGSIPAEWAVEYVVDRVDTLGTVWLGLTIGCARCHDHKYDPVSQKDYYSLFAYFNNIAEWGLGPNNGNSPPFVEVPASWPNLSQEDDQFLTPKPYKLKTTQTSVVRPLPGSPKTVMVMHERQTPRKSYLLKRGQYNLPDKTTEVHPGVPSVLGEASDDHTPNRLGLARWLVDPTNPLTARVIMNRYWQHFFETGLVKTSENFGIQGDFPSHPELLDWLATEFIRQDWNVKAMHRLIVTSATYRQSSVISQTLRKADPENRLLARGPRKRLSGQVIRDQALAASGLLVTELGGPSVKPYMPPGIWKSISNNRYQQDHGSKLYRRSLYTYWRRTIPPPTMLTFNAAERETCIVRKSQTNSPLQALTLMNNVAFMEASRKLAERMLNEGGETVEQQIGYGFELLIARRPSSREVDLLTEAYGRLVGHYRNNPHAAKQLLSIGESPRDTRLDLPIHAAMTMIASTLFNLDETITKE